MISPLLLALALVTGPAAPQAHAPDRFAALVAGIEKAALAGNRDAIRAFGEPEALTDFAIALTVPTPSRVAIRERDRTALPDGTQRMLIELFWERGIEGRLSTWTLDVAVSESALRVRAATRVAQVAGLYRLALDRTRQYDVRNLTVRGPDLSLQLSSGAAFLANTHDGATAIVLVGDGEMHFAPETAAERTQVRIFGGAETLRAGFDGAFIRVRPEEFESKFPAGTLVERPPNSGDLRRAHELFETYIGRTLQIDLGDLSTDRWSITPQAGDMIAEIRTRRFGSLTYTRSRNDAEDVTLFDRRRRRNIAVYASAEKLATRGRFYSEDDLVDYDVLAYDVTAAVTPERQRIDGTALLKLKIRAAATSTLNLRLAEELTVSGVYSADFGRLLHLRIVNQNSLIVSLPATMTAGTEVTLRVNYSGPFRPQELEREAVTVQQEIVDPIQIPAEPRFLYSNRSYWYPQSTVTDYAAVRLRINVPSVYEVVATGVRSEAAASASSDAAGAQRGRRTIEFVSERPVRYVSFVVSRLRDVVTLRSKPAATAASVPFRVLANSRQASRARSMSTRGVEIFGYYVSLLDDAPYPEFTLAVTERELPGGHSPAYFAIVDQPMQGGLSWRNDPVNFDSYPEFFMAHEIAHQWWGQAVGWKNYHEQWLSEGFAQYFAALYAEAHLSPAVAHNVFRRMRDTAIEHSADGPVHLGYRLGHVQGDPGVFRSILYNKGAMVLHMLRRLVGDEVFFRGVRQFYGEWKYRKAGTSDFMAVMERVSGRNLAAFFEAWVFGVGIPAARLTHSLDGSTLTLKIEQLQPTVEFPVAVRITYASGRTENVPMIVAGPVTERAVQVKERVRSVTANADHGALAVFR